MNNPKVSIIIPVYNTELYVEKAVRSIMDQTLRDIEIIIIDDGSTDRSSLILKKLEREDKRIHVYTQVNQGQSTSRNNAMRHIKGKYVYFMDSDDYLEPEALCACYDKCESKRLDFVFFDADILNKENHFNINLKYQRKNCTDQTKIYNGPEILNILLDHDCYSPSPCLSFIRSEFLVRVKLSFLDGIIHEDQLFTSLLYLQGTRISCIHKDFFKRRLRENSTMTRQFSMRNMECYFIVSDHLLSFASTHKENQSTIDKYLFKMLNAAVWLSYKIPFANRIKIAYLCVSKYRKYVSKRNLLVLLFKSFIKK